jgi:predicted  nucleic acid-binding Zn-ribbon protein
LLKEALSASETSLLSTKSELETALSHSGEQGRAAESLAREAEGLRGRVDAAERALAGEKELRLAAEAHSVSCEERERERVRAAEDEVKNMAATLQGLSQKVWTLSNELETARAELRAQAASVASAASASAASGSAVAQKTVAPETQEDLLASLLPPSSSSSMHVTPQLPGHLVARPLSDEAAVRKEVRALREEARVQSERAAQAIARCARVEEERDSLTDSLRSSLRAVMAQVAQLEQEKAEMVAAVATAATTAAAAAAIPPLQAFQPQPSTSLFNTVPLSELDRERREWDAERASLKTRISELELEREAMLSQIADLETAVREMFARTPAVGSSSSSSLSSLGPGDPGLKGRVLQPRGRGVKRGVPVTLSLIDYMVQISKTLVHPFKDGSTKPPEKLQQV